MAENLTPIEGINEYYRLKSKYETDYYEKYVKAIVKSDKSKKEKKNMFARLPKNECINCKRNVETLFKIQNNYEDSLEIFTVKCGDIADPCPLNIEIHYGFRIKLDEEINEGLKSINKHKLNIIKEKNNTLFFSGFNETIFNKLTETLKNETANVGSFSETKILRYDNPKKYELLNELSNEFGYNYLVPFKQMVKKFDETNNDVEITQAVQFYVNEMLVKIKELRELNYEINNVEYDELNKVYYLNQKSNTYEHNEYFFSEDDKVVSFIKGIKQNNKAKTKKVNKFKIMEDEDENEKLTNNNKTKKLKFIIKENEENDIIEFEKFKKNKMEEVFGCDTDSDTSECLKSDANTEIRSDANTEVKSDASTEIRSDANTEVKSDANTEVRSDANTEK